MTMTTFCAVYLLIAAVMFIGASMVCRKTPEKYSDTSFFEVIIVSLMWGILVPLSLAVYGVSYLCDLWQGWVNK